MPERNPFIPVRKTTVSCIQHANVETSNVPRSQEWYKKVFDAEWTAEGPRFLKLGNSELHLHEEAHPIPHKTNHFAIEVEDWDSWLTNIKGAGVKLEREPMMRDGGKQTCFVRDPDGNLIEVMHHAHWHKE